MPLTQTAPIDNLAELDELAEIDTGAAPSHRLSRSMDDEDADEEELVEAKDGYPRKYPERNVLKLFLNYGGKTSVYSHEAH